MKVIQAKSAGFCYGVERAVKMAGKTAEQYGGCKMLGSIVHNANVVAELATRGAQEVSSIEEIQSGDTVLVRAHGERKEILEELERRRAVCVNATCPNVLRIQNLVAQADKEGRIPVIIGEAHHPEVMGIASWCDRSVIFENAVELEKWLQEDVRRRDFPLTVVAQTTCIRAIWESSAKK